MPQIHEPAALPGGYVFVPAALFLAAQDEAEFAGMLAHAMQHVSRRHGMQQGRATDNANRPVVYMGGWSGGCAETPAVPRGSLTLQRSNELEADFLAVQTMAHAGFDPMALVRYIERVQGRPDGTVSQADSPLPDRDQRLTTMRSAIEKLPAVEYAAAAGEFAAVQQEVRRLAAAPARSMTPPSLMRKAP
jgi:predicted Zn-dependent protease